MRTFNELKLFSIAARYKWAYHKSNPDVGMGPFFQSIIEDLSVEAKIPLTKDEESLILKDLQKHFKRD